MGAKRHCTFFIGMKTTTYHWGMSGWWRRARIPVFRDPMECLCCIFYGILLNYVDINAHLLLLLGFIPCWWWFSAPGGDRRHPILHVPWGYWDQTSIYCNIHKSCYHINILIIIHLRIWIYVYTQLKSSDMWLLYTYKRIDVFLTYTLFQ